MSEHNKPQTLAEYHQNFEQIKPLMDATQAMNESARCLFCYDAPCVNACPTGIDIPLFIKQINTGNLNGAAKTIYDANYFGNICGKVCPTEVLCEGACVFNEQDAKPIEIGRLQTHACTHVIENEIDLFPKAEKNSKRVAIVGAGPAGISCACELSKLGYHVDIFEATDWPSGLALSGTAPYKITNKEVLKEMQYLVNQFELQLTYNSRIDTKEAFERLEAEYDAIFLGIGLGKTRSLKLEGEEIEGVYGAAEFIANLKMQPLQTKVGQKVIVIGGGNTAMDAASESARMGAEEVVLAYRRSKEEMSAYEFELDLAKSVGVQARFNLQPVKILGESKVEGIRFAKTETKDGKLKSIEGSEFDLACDMVIKATGQMKQTHILDMIGLGYDKGGRIQVNDQSFQCTNPKYFAGGDAVNGGAEVVNASAEAKKAAQGIHQFLSTK